MYPVFSDNLEKRSFSIIIMLLNLRSSIVARKTNQSKREAAWDPPAARSLGWWQRQLGCWPPRCRGDGHAWRGLQEPAARRTALLAESREQREPGHSPAAGGSSAGGEAGRSHQRWHRWRRSRGLQRKTGWGQHLLLWARPQQAVAVRVCLAGGPRLFLLNCAGWSFPTLSALLWMRDAFLRCVSAT